MVASLFDGYLGGEAAGFYPSHFADAAARVRAVAAAPAIHPVIAAALQAQNARLAPSRARALHLQDLAEGAAAVVTGQQVGLFGGPLFNYYKAVTAIRLASQLQRETGRRVVPIFWLQTEDHDLPEIAQLGCVDGDGTPYPISLPGARPQRVSVAHLAFDDELEGALQRLAAALGHGPHATEHLQRLRRWYRPGQSWGEAFAQYFAELFAEAGLIFIQPRDPAFTDVMRSLHERALRDAEAIATALRRRSQALADAGWTAPVHVREGAPLSFFHPWGPNGPRHRLAPDPQGWREVGGETVHHPDAIRAALARDPLVCSTSVLLRPIYQDLLLPTAAYVGGPGEVAYFAQLAPLYEHFDRPMPLVVPRARLRLLAPRDRLTLVRHGLDASQLRSDVESLLRPHTETGALQDHLLQPFLATLAAAEAEILAAGPGLDSALAKTRATVASAVARLSEKVARARLQSDEQTLQQLHRVQSHLFPLGHPQERFFGLAPFAARFGEATVLHSISAAIDPLDPSERDVVLGEPARPAETAA